MPLRTTGFSEEFPAVAENFSDDALRMAEDEGVMTSDVDALNYPAEGESVSDWAESYLVGGHHGAHQFTVNHITFPFVRDLNFAAFPVVPPISDQNSNLDLTSLRRQMEIFSGAASVRPGDLMFFYKSDTQQESLGDFEDPYRNRLERNRGIVGVYRALSEAFVDPTAVEHPNLAPKDEAPVDHNYRIAGKCSNPECGCLFSWMRGDSKSSPFDEGSVGGESVGENWCAGSLLYDNRDHQNGNTGYGSLTLSGRIWIEPIAAYRLPAADNSVYGNLEGRSVIWTGRFDNAMGAGKSSTIRHLLPEEGGELATTLEQTAELLTDSVDETVAGGEPSDYPGSNTVLPLIYHDGRPVKRPWIVRINPMDALEDIYGISDTIADRLRNSGVMTVEEVEQSSDDQLTQIKGIGPSTLSGIRDYLGQEERYRARLENNLFLDMSKNIDKRSNFVGLLSDIVGERVGDIIDNLEFYSWEFPWGFANDQCDFVCTYRNESRTEAVLVENKRGCLDSPDPLAELMLYTPWVARVLTRFVKPTPETFRLTPVLVAQGIEKWENPVTTSEYELPDDVPINGDIEVTIAESKFVEYGVDPSATQMIADECITEEFKYTDRSADLNTVSWNPGFSVLSATGNEAAFVAENWLESQGE